MKIVSGASSVKTFVERIDAGVDEIFCGYISPEWIEKYKYLISPNRRWGKLANFTSIIDLKCAINIAHKNNIKVTFALNTHSYNNAQMDLLSNIIDDAVKAGIDNFIVADLGILLYVINRYPEITVHISTGGTVFNDEAVNFYNNLGVKRIVFDRLLPPDEAINISDKYPNMEFEVFMSNARCSNIDGFCNFEHAITYLSNCNKIDNFPMCGLNYNIELVTDKKLMVKEREKICDSFIKKRNFNAYPKACAACYLYKFSKHNIDFVKIPARASADTNNRIKILKETTFIKKMIKSINDFENESEYEVYAKEMFYEYFNIKCVKRGINCYY